MAETTFSPQIRVCKGLADICECAHDMIVQIASKRPSASEPVSVALSGGSTPKRVYEELHSRNMNLLKDDKAFIFLLGDERLVPVDNENSNYRMAYDALLRDVPEECILQLDPAPAVATAADPKLGIQGAREAATAYERLLLERLPVFSCTVNEQSVKIPIVDIVLLGIGSDGHTASIFPGSVAAEDNMHVVSVSFPSPTMNPKVWRVTLTKHVIQNARHVVVMAAGMEKQMVMHHIIDRATPPPESTPVARFLRECKGSVTFLMDEAAAGMLKSNF